MAKAIEKIKDTYKANKNILFIVFILIILVIDVIMYSNFIYNERSYYTEDYLAYDSSLKSDENVGASRINQNVNVDGSNHIDSVFCINCGIIVMAIVAKHT